MEIIILYYYTKLLSYIHTCMKKIYKIYQFIVACGDVFSDKGVKFHRSSCGRFIQVACLFQYF